jgi:TonB family protein
MDERSSTASSVTGLIIGAFGLLNVVLGIMAVISGAFPSAEGEFFASSIGVGSIFFGLAMLIAGAFWVTSGVGFLTRQEWAPALALYVAPIIVAINIIGVLRFWGFAVNIGWAAINSVTGIGSIWYLSRKELASFFLIAVAEHVFVIIIFAALIYAEPGDTAAQTEDEAVLVTLEQMKQQEPLLADIITRKRTKMEEPPDIPKIEIRSVTATEPEAEIEDFTPQLPKTHAQVMDEGLDTVLRSPGRVDREQRNQDTIPAVGVESALDSSKKPVLETGSLEKKEVSREPAARTPGDIRKAVTPTDGYLGPSDEVARPSFVGEITGEIGKAGRKVVFWPKRPEGFRGTEGGSAAIMFWVDPAGNVTRVKLSKKSGNPRLDKIALGYVEQIRFEELPENFQQKVQSGEISINFKLIREAK